MIDSPRVLAPGLEIDQFRLKERIFTGGMGSIWRVDLTDDSTLSTGGSEIILKIPFISAGSDVAAIVAFEIEEMIMKRLYGPHVPKVYATGDLSKIPYIAMEFVEGAPLSSMLLGVPVSPEEVLRVGRLMTRAVADIHRQHVIHLDLKPANIIMAKRGAVLIDFGLARHDELPDLMGEETRLPVGSAAYMAPEQTVGDRSQPSSDLFAIGAILFELASGVVPFGVPVTTHGLKQRMDIDLATLTPKLSVLPPGLAEIILRCLEPKPENRYPTADQLLFDLNHPDRVVPTERLTRRPKRWLERLGNWWAKPPPEPRRKQGNMAQHLALAPVILAAVDLSHGSDQLAESVRLYVRRALEAEPFARLACVTVLKSKVIGEDPLHDSEGRSAYHGRLVALKEWARPLASDDDTISYHVLEGVDAGATILDYVVNNSIDHIVMGARSSSTLRRHLGSVSSKVVAGAPCTVTVVRLRAGGETDQSELPEEAESP